MKKVLCDVQVITVLPMKISTKRIKTLTKALPATPTINLITKGEFTMEKSIVATIATIIRSIQTATSSNKYTLYDLHQVDTT